MSKKKQGDGIEQGLALLPENACTLLRRFCGLSWLELSCDQVKELLCSQGNQGESENHPGPRIFGASTFPSSLLTSSARHVCSLCFPRGTECPHTSPLRAILWRLCFGYTACVLIQPERPKLKNRPAKKTNPLVLSTCLKPG